MKKARIRPSLGRWIAVSPCQRFSAVADTPVEAFKFLKMIYRPPLDLRYNKDRHGF